MTKKKDDSWCDQFTRSIQKWSETKYPRKDAMDPDTLTNSINANTLTDFSGDDQEGNLVALAMVAILRQMAQLVFQDLEQMMLKCTSPIELPMLLALAIVGRELGNGIRYRIEDLSFGDPEDVALEFLCIEPQAQLGDYRVDFLVTHESLFPDKVVWTKLIVECDDHDYRTRTKEQARKVKARDRKLQSLGYKVHRYTGSEIWADVFHCAQEAVGSFMDATDEKHRGTTEKEGPDWTIRMWTPARSCTSAWA